MLVLAKCSWGSTHPFPARVVWRFSWFRVFLRLLLSFPLLGHGCSSAMLSTGCSSSLALQIILLPCSSFVRLLCWSTWEKESLRQTSLFFFWKSKENYNGFCTLFHQKFVKDCIPNKKLNHKFKIKSIFLKIILWSKDFEMLLAANIGFDLNFIILNFFILVIQLFLL